MKGIVFTEFMEMVEDQFGFIIADEIISESDLASGGVYSAVGTYDYKEMVSLVLKLSQKTNIEIPDLLKAFGKYLFGRFVQGYGMFFENVSDIFEFLSGIDNYIHVEVLKLYPQAELPKFLIEQKDANTLEMEYKSERGFADFAEGLLLGCIEHFQEDIQINRTDISPNGTHTCFVLSKVAISQTVELGWKASNK